MKRLYNRLTGNPLELPTPEERKAARMARMRHLVWLGVRTLAGMAEIDGARLIMYTLTYRGLSDWQPRHIGGLTRWLRRQGHIGYLWVGELQARGAIHYHVLAALPNGQRWKKPEENNGWSHGFTWVTDEIKRPFYIMKYLQKGDSHGRRTFYPKGFRLYAVSQRIVRRMAYEDAFDYRLSQLPRWIRQGSNRSWHLRCAYRVRAGVAVGRFTAVSPYTAKRLPRPGKVKLQMVYNMR
jgi:hypothetical protein